MRCEGTILGFLRVLGGIVAVGVLAVSSGCGLSLPTPVPESVDPEWGYNGEDTRIDIYGKNFYPQVEVSAASEGESDVDRSFIVRLRGPTDGDASVEYTLPGVTLLDYRHMHATVRAGLEPGPYDVLVYSPTGTVGELTDAFTVTDTRVDHIAVDVDSVVFEVYETAWLDITLADPAGQRVLQPLDVAITAVGDTAAVAATYDTSALSSWSYNGDELHISLDDQGFARVGVTVDVPDLVEITVTPQDSRSVVDHADVRLLWEPGVDLALEIGLPDDSGQMSVEAGEPFPVELTLVDQWGNIVEDSPTDVWLMDFCQTWYVELAVSGKTTVDARLLAATGTLSCPEDHLLSLVGPPGQSAPISVVPAAAEQLEVQVFEESIIAGEDLNVFVDPQDAYGNLANYPWDLPSIDMDDSEGGVDTFTCFGKVGSLFCQVQHTVAGEDVVLSVGTEDGLTGDSNPFQVVAGEPANLEVNLGKTVVAAGEPVTVEVPVTDTWGNAYDGPDLSGMIVIADDLGEVSCTSTGPVDGVPTYDCTLQTAYTGNHLRATLLVPSVAATSDPFDVVNGELALIDVEVADLAPTAGDSVSVTFTAFDAFDNPYVVITNPILSVGDTSGSFSVTSAVLGSSGDVTLSGLFTVAGDTQITASQGGTVYGASDIVAVLPGTATDLMVEYAEPWGWTHLPVVVDVSAVDMYGNVSENADEVTVSSVSGLATPVELVLVDGQGRAELEFTAPGLLEVVSAVSETGITGATNPGVIVQECGVNGPTASLSFLGEGHALACWDPLTEPTILASVDAAAGLTPLAVYGALIEGGQAAMGSSPSLSVPVPEPGQLLVRGMAAAADGCGAEATAYAYVAEADGEPVGPLTITAGSPSVSVGVDVTTLTISDATDCAGDVAVGGRVRMWTDLGYLTGVSATGEGLELTLDASGSAVAGLNSTSACCGGTMTAVAWVPSGAAAGTGSTEFVGDHRRPTVWDQEPSGDQAGTFDTIILYTTETLLSVDPAFFSFDGPEAVSIVDASQPEDGRLEIVLSEPVDAALGVWTITAHSDLRDLAGNRLDGSQTGAASDYVGVFGDLPPAVAPVDSCEPDAYVFRPDGDDGVGIEADSTEIALTSALAPVWWRVKIVDEGGGLVGTAMPVAAGSTDTWTWGGRDNSGKIVPNGGYTITVDADDGMGNRGGGCTTMVTVDNRVGL